MTQLENIAKAGILCLALFFSSCEKKPDYIQTGRKSYIEIEYEKLSRCNYFARESIESYFGYPRRNKLNKNLVGSWALKPLDNIKIGVISGDIERKNIYPVMNLEDNKPECFPVLKNPIIKNDELHYDLDFFADKKFLEIYPHLVGSGRPLHFKQVYKELYMVSCKDIAPINRRLIFLIHSSPGSKNSKMVLYLSNQLFSELAFSD